MWLVGWGVNFDGCVWDNKWRARQPALCSRAPCLRQPINLGCCGSAAVTRTSVCGQRQPTLCSRDPYLRQRVDLDCCCGAAVARTNICGQRQPILRLCAPCLQQRVDYYCCSGAATIVCGQRQPTCVGVSHICGSDYT